MQTADKLKVDTATQERAAAIADAAETIATSPQTKAVARHIAGLIREMHLPALD